MHSCFLRTESMCCPQPAHVFFPQVAQSTGKHMAEAERGRRRKARLFEALYRRRDVVIDAAVHAADVAATPGGSSHKNIRGLAANGWAGVRFEGTPLRPRA